MPQPYEHIPEELKKQAAKSSEPKPPKITGAEKEQRRLFFKRKRAGIVLTRDEVKAIKAGRKKLRREMKQRGIKSRKEFEITAAGLGLYFDKRRGLLAWLLRHWFLAGLLTLLALLIVLFIFSAVTQLKGLFTINLSPGMFREGFSLSDDAAFTNPTSNLCSNPAEDVPAISINQIPANVDQIDGEHNDVYFAYTYYIRNEGENSVDYHWQLDINTDTQKLSNACWVMLFEDGQMKLYAKPNALTGAAEALPPYGDDSRGYVHLPVVELAPDSEQFEIVRTVGSTPYYRVVPYPFASDTMVTQGYQSSVPPMGVHKYTVVLWIEGDDADTTDDLIGGHMGVEMNFSLVSENNAGGSGMQNFWDALKFWQ